VNGQASFLAAVIHLLPTLWFRNTWSWGCSHEGCWPKPFIRGTVDGTLLAHHVTVGKFRLAAAAADGTVPELLFTENATNTARLFGAANSDAYVKDAFHEYIINGRTDAVNPKGQGTKAAAHYQHSIPAGKHAIFQLRLCAEDEASPQPFGPAFDSWRRSPLRAVGPESMGCVRRFVGSLPIQQMCPQAGSFPRVFKSRIFEILASIARLW
jgi:hypothetical protein